MNYFGIKEDEFKMKYLDACKIIQALELKKSYWAVTVYLNKLQFLLDLWNVR